MRSCTCCRSSRTSCSWLRSPCEADVTPSAVQADHGTSWGSRWSSAMSVGHVARQTLSSHKQQTFSSASGSTTPRDGGGQEKEPPHGLDYSVAADEASTESTLARSPPISDFWTSVELDDVPDSTSNGDAHGIADLFLKFHVHNKPSVKAHGTGTVRHKQFMSPRCCSNSRDPYFTSRASWPRNTKTQRTRKQFPRLDRRIPSKCVTMTMAKLVED